MGIPVSAGMTRARSVQLAKKLGEIAVARLVGGSLKRTAKGGHHARMLGRYVDPDRPPVHIYRRGGHLLLLGLHLALRTTG